jgi:murein L,D-transpeptidase YafK
MRTNIRPIYNFRRSLYLAGINFHVWRRNRETARAFYDPLLDNGYRKLPSVFRSAHKRLVGAGFLGLAILGSVFLSVRFAIPYLEGFRFQRQTAELAALPSVPAAPLAAAPIAAPAPLPVPEPKAGPEPEAALVLPPVPAAAPPEPEMIHLPENGFYLIACKRDRTLYAYRRVGDAWEKAVAYPMAIGRAFGDKSDAGDLRTPEGRFWITGLFPGASKGPIYGPLVLTLNYPRPGDEAEGKSGQGIWIHGTEMGKLPSYTHGCLSLANEDMLALSAFADVGTPLVILPDDVAPDPGKQMDLAGMEREYPSILSAYGRKTKADTLAKAKALKEAGDFVVKESRDFPELSMQNLSGKDKQAILDRLTQWREDWSSRSVEKYGENYDPDFRDKDGRDKQSFLERKSKIFESKSKIKMEIASPQIEPEGYSRVKVSFRQDYLAEGGRGLQRSSGPKTIRMESGPTGWLIITE